MHSFGSFKKLGVDQNFYPLRTPSRRWTSSNTLSLERFTARHLTPDDRWQWDHTFNGEHFPSQRESSQLSKGDLPYLPDSRRSRDPEHDPRLLTVPTLRSTFEASHRLGGLGGARSRTRRREPANPGAPEPPRSHEATGTRSRESRESPGSH